MALLREVHPAELGLAGRVKAIRQNPPRTVVFEQDGTVVQAVPLTGLRQRLASQGGAFYGEFLSPTPEELAALQAEFGFHPLALEDVQSRHQRPKIDVYEDHYFMVFYRIGTQAGNDDTLIQEIDFFIGRNFLVVTHDSEIPLLDQVFERFCRSSDKKNVSRLLYEILDALVDEYFPFLDEVAERAGAIEDAIFKEFQPADIEGVLALKRDLALLRRIVGPERDTVNVLLRRDPPCIDPAQIFYFQDIYDHLVRVTDSIDTYRELLTGSLDAFLSIQNNRLSEIVRKLTVISITFLPLTFISGFFGMNFHIFEKANHVLFGLSLVLMVVVPVVLLSYLRRKGLE